MSVGSWILAGDRATAAAIATAHELLRPVRPRSGASRAACRRSSACRSRPTPRRCSRTPRCRSGTRRGASCRSCSPAAPRRAPARRRRSSRRRRTPARRGAWRCSACSSRCAAMQLMEHRLGELARAVPRGRGGHLREAREGALARRRRGDASHAGGRRARRGRRRRDDPRRLGAASAGRSSRPASQSADGPEVHGRPAAGADRGAMATPDDAGRCDGGRAAGRRAPADRALPRRARASGGSDLLAGEEPLEIRLEGEPVAVTMRTPVARAGRRARARLPARRGDRRRRTRSRA